METIAPTKPPAFRIILSFPAFTFATIFPPPYSHLSQIPVGPNPASLLAGSMNKFIVEFIGTFFLVQAVGYAALTKSALGAFAVGLMLMVMVYAGGHISGAHYNPAVTLAVWLRGKLPKSDVLPIS